MVFQLDFIVLLTLCSELFPYTTLFRSSLSNNPFDVLIMAVFGVVGYFCAKLECEPAPMILGFILGPRSEEHTSELQSHSDLVCRLLLEKKITFMPASRYRQVLVITATT